MRQSDRNIETKIKEYQTIILNNNIIRIIGSQTMVNRKITYKKVLVCERR